MIELVYDFRLISKDNEKIMNKKGRFFLSGRFKRFEKQVRLYTMTQFNNPPLEGDLEVTLLANFTNKVHSDCSNLGKGVLDALQGLIYKNDRQIKRYKCAVLEKEPKDSFIVLVWEIPTTKF